MAVQAQVNITELKNLGFALMGRLHVALRRHTGRITDIEYMQANSDYCRYVLDLTMQIPSEDLRPICKRLEEIYFGPDGLFLRQEPKPPLFARGRTPVIPGPSTVSANSDDDKNMLPPADTFSQVKRGEAIERAYVGRLR